MVTAGDLGVGDCRYGSLGSKNSGNVGWRSVRFLLDQYSGSPLEVVHLTVLRPIIAWFQTVKV